MNIQKNNFNFKGVNAFNIVANIESNILLNKGITEFGGGVVPQALQANNLVEALERAGKLTLYFIATFLTPFVFLPLINKGALKHFNIIKNFKNTDKQILQVSKEYLTKDGEYLKKGIKETAKKLFNDETKFDRILAEHQDLEKFRKDLINTHTAIHCTDFITTNALVASIPWVVNLLSKKKTNRSGYSGTYKIADEDFTKINGSKYEKSQKIRQGISIATALLPAFTVPFLVKNGMLNKGNGVTSKWFNKNAKYFDYKKSIYMSRLTALIMWITSWDIPFLLSSRDKYELKDTFIRTSAVGVVFWGGDLLLKRIFAKISDKLFNTNIYNKKEKRPYSLDELKNYKNIESLQKLSEKTMNKTKKSAVGLYILNLSLIIASLGIAMPQILNKHLRKSVKEDKEKQITQQNIISPNKT